MGYIEQIRELFYSNNIELAIQLIKSQGYELRDVLKELYYKYVDGCDDFYDNNFELTYGGHIEMYGSTIGAWEDYRLWLDTEVIDDLTLDQCLDKMTDYLIENYE